MPAGVGRDGPPAEALNSYPGEIEKLRGDDRLVIATALKELEQLPVARPPLRRTVADQALAWAGSLAWPAGVYACSRLVVFLVAWVDSLITHRPLAAEPALFDGQWYLKLAGHGYPVQAIHGKSTLGFLPLYPLVIRGLASLSGTSLLTAALFAAFAGGLVTVVLVQRIATIWWGERTARRAVLVFCLFPGSIVFSMAYSECLTLPLAVGCLLALRSRRWLTAGALAGLASAVEPAALILVPVCLAVSIRQIMAFGWRDRVTWHSLTAPLLAPLGLSLFGIYLWHRTGTPFASYAAQHSGWHQGDPLTLLSQPVARQLLHHPASLLGHLPNPSLWNGVLGSAFLICAVMALRPVRHELSPGVMVWTTGVGILTLWSVMSLTNARMLLIAFPAVIVWARTLTGRRYQLFLVAEIAVFLLASGLTLAGAMLP
ncbi:MAG TPA: mannosyltransferase family protein [Streptosporangiaceae bacterium]|nr:mannosyltransferase family protein [Streptosporangiaceae bacterium]